jgi:hypothetical protein
VSGPRPSLEDSHIESIVNRYCGWPADPLLLGSGQLWQRRVGCLGRLANRQRLLGKPGVDPDTFQVRPGEPPWLRH